ncbi:MAG: 50S ribosomal protein L25 [Acidobacteriota bacterium]
MTQFTIEAQVREGRGKNESRRLRTQGMIPGVVYGRGFPATAVSVDPKKVERVLTSETGRNSIFKLQLSNQSADVLVKDFQLDPVVGNLTHVDFQRISMDEVMEFEVHIEPVGTAAGVKAGGIVDLVLRAVLLECLPSDVPSEIAVPVDALEIGDVVRVADLKVDTSKIKVLTEPDLVVVSVVPPRVEEEVIVAAEGTEEEPEVIRKGKLEEEETAGE